MKVSAFFEMMEKSNDFKELIREHKTKILAIYYDSQTKRWHQLGSAFTFEEFKKLIEDTFCEEVSGKIVNATIEDTLAHREFRIFYWFDNEPKCLKLFVE